MYKLIFEKRALQNLNKLDEQIKKGVWNKLQQCKENPTRFLKPLVQVKGFKLRVGNHRIIIDIKEEIKVLHILKVGHRKNIYDR